MARQERLDRDIVKSTLNAVVQVVALRQGFLGNLSTAWTGSGTIIDPRGYILTNCHVANPRASPLLLLILSILLRNPQKRI